MNKEELGIEKAKLIQKAGRELNKFVVLYRLNKEINGLIDQLDEPENVIELEQELQVFLSQIYGWASKIEREAIEAKNDEIIDDALIIQETVEEFLYDKGIQPESVLNTENKTNNKEEE